jgi:hypothetical protein
MNLESFNTGAEKVIEKYDCNGKNIPDTFTVLRELHVRLRSKYDYGEIRDMYQQIVYTIWEQRDRKFQR